MAQLKVDKYNAFVRPYSVHLATDVFSSSGSDSLTVSVSYNFLGCCIGLYVTMAMTVSDHSSVVPCFVVIALCVELEATNESSDVIVFVF